jgi:hypothetical protein
MEAPVWRRAPPLIVWMSFRLAIPRRVVLQQRPPSLHQPSTIVRQSRLAVEFFSSNGVLCLNCLCQPRRQAQIRLTGACQIDLALTPLSFPHLNHLVGRIILRDEAKNRKIFARQKLPYTKDRTARSNFVLLKSPPLWFSRYPQKVQTTKKKVRIARAGRRLSP